MILKIAYDGGWTLKDGFKHVSYKCIPEEDEDNILWDEKYIVKDSKCALMVVSCLRREDGSLYTLVTNCTTYVLSDAGKTVEKVVGLI